MFCIELFIVLMDEFIVVMIGATKVVVIETFAIEQFTTERDNGDAVR